MANLKARLLRRLDGMTMPMQINAINRGLLPNNTGVPAIIEGEITIRTPENENSKP